MECLLSNKINKNIQLAIEGVSKSLTGFVFVSTGQGDKADGKNYKKYKGMAWKKMFVNNRIKESLW